MTVLDYLRDHFLLLDGGTGTMLQAAGLKSGERPELWNLSRPEAIAALHEAYFRAGSNVVASNTFGVNLFHYSPEEADRLMTAAVSLAKKAASAVSHPTFIACDLGPTGRMLKPLGDLDPEKAVENYAFLARSAERAGADLILIETMNDALETKAALLGVREGCGLPVFVSNAYSENGRLMTGASPLAMVSLLEGMGADAVGVNCSFGPRELVPVVREYLRHASVPVLMKANAGMPRVDNGKTVYDISPEEFAETEAAMAAEGVRILGGCCGTTPVHIAALAKALAGMTPVPVLPKQETVVCSGSQAAVFGQEPLLIGERINPTGKKKLKQALLDGDWSYVLEQATLQEERGVHLLDVNVGVPGIDEPAVLARAVQELQAVTSLPLQIDTSDPAAMEAALRVYNGKALINSVSGKQESMDAIFPLVRKYGGVVIALTLDENGIPETAEGRVAIARRILKEAASYGLSEKDQQCFLRPSQPGKPERRLLRPGPGAGAVRGDHESLLRSHDAVLAGIQSPAPHGSELRGMDSQRPRRGLRRPAAGNRPFPEPGGRPGLPPAGRKPGRRAAENKGRAVHHSGGDYSRPERGGRRLRKENPVPAPAADERGGGLRRL